MAEYKEIVFERPKLKPCPFCGSAEIAIEYYKETEIEDAYFQICCDHCGAMTGKCGVSYTYVNEALDAYLSAAEKVINNWNIRAKE